MCYYAAASLEYWQKNQAKVRFIIPTGNMGNAVACFWAQKMGFPIDKIIMTTNENSVLSDFYKTGQLHPQSSKKTLANAMDVGNPSNFERLVNLYPQLDNLLKISKVYLVTDQEIKQSIQSFKQNFDTVICPHTATAYAGYLKMCPLLQQNSIIVATAHPAKFCEVVEPLLNQKVVWPEALLKLGQREAHYETIFPEVERVKEFI
jgi:threonine synthase